MNTPSFRRDPRDGEIVLVLRGYCYDHKQQPSLAETLGFYPEEPQKIYHRECAVLSVYRPYEPTDAERIILLTALLNRS